VGQESYREFDGDRFVGRIYRADTQGGFWGLAWEVTEPANPPNGAQEPTREAAMGKFEAAYLACVAPKWWIIQTKRLIGRPHRQ
jgi:hypothetical protein